MSPCHCQCQPDHHIVLQSKNHANNGKKGIYPHLCVGADWFGKELRNCYPQRLISFPYMYAHERTGGSLVHST